MTKRKLIIRQTSSSLGTFTGAAGSMFPDSMAVIAAVAMIGAAMV